MKYLFFFLITLWMACGCSSPSPDHFRERGSALIRTLVKELKASRSREEFMDRQKKIEQTFQELRSLVQEIKLYNKAHPEKEIPLFTRQDQDLSDELRAEINRLLRLEGCCEVLNQLLTK